MKNGILRHLTFWKIIGAIIVGFGLYSTYLRVTLGLGATTNLSDNFPWGMWIGFDILCGNQVGYGPLVSGRDKLSQKWSFKSEPLWG